MPKKSATPKKSDTIATSTLVSLAEIAAENAERVNRTLSAHPGAIKYTDEFHALQTTLDAGIAADRQRILAATPRTLADVAVQIMILHHQAWLAEGEEYDDDNARPSLVLARALKVVAEHAELDLRAVGGEELIDDDAGEVFPEFALGVAAE